MKHTRWFTLLLAVLLFCCAVPAGAYYDVYSGVRISDWALEDVTKANMSHYNLLCLSLSRTDMTLPITKAEFCDCLLRLVGSGGTDFGYPSPFTDTDRYSVYCLAQKGIVTGGEDGKFAPDGYLPRELAAVFIARTIKYLQYTYTPEECAPYSDANDISEWAQASVADVQCAGIMIGTDKGEFLPQEYLTREEAAILLVRLFEKLRDADNTLPYGYDFPIYIKGKEVVYRYDQNNTVSTFHIYDTGETLFTLEGNVTMVTNKYIIMETYGYSFPSVDAAYTHYGVYNLDGTLVEEMGLSKVDMYDKGYAEDWLF